MMGAKPLEGSEVEPSNGFEKFRGHEPLDVYTGAASVSRTRPSSLRTRSSD